MSLNQSRAEKSEGQLRKPGRSANSTQARSFAGSGSSGKGGGATAPPFPSSSSTSFSTNRSSKKSSHGQGGQSRTGHTSANSESSGAIAASRPVQNGAHVQSQLQDAPVSGVTKMVDPAASKGYRVIPRAPSSQSASGPSDSTAPATPSKGDVPKAFPLQFGSISPGFMNGMQIPARTSSAPPNLDEQKRDQARHDSFIAAPTLPIPSAPKQPQVMKDVSSIKQSNTAGSHPPTQTRRDAHVQIPAPPAATSAPKSSVLPITGVSMPMPFQHPQVSLQFGGPTQHIQAQGIAATSLQMPLPLPMGNASQVQQQVFVPSLQSHQLQPQGMMHLGQNLGFAHQPGHQLAPPLSNLGVGVAPQFGQPQAGKFGGSRITVKITHPDTHEELRLDKRTDTYTDTGSSGQRSHSNMPPQSQPIPSFSPAHSMNYYSPIPPTSYNPPPIFFSSATSLPLTSTQMTPAPTSSRYNYPVGQGGQPLSFMNTSALNPLPISKGGPHMHGISEPANLEHARNGHALPVSAQSASVRVTVKPAVGSLPEKIGNKSVTVSSHVSKSDSPKLLRQPSEASMSHQQKSSDLGSESCSQQPNSLVESSDAVPLHVTAKHSTPSTAASIPSLPSSTSSSRPSTPTEDSASATANAEGRRRETVRKSDSFKDQQKRAGKKEQRHYQQQHQADVYDSTGILKSSSVTISKDSSSPDLHASQVSKNGDIVHAPSEVVGISAASPSLPSPSLEQSVSSCGGVSGTAEGKVIPSTLETSELILAAPTKVPQDVHADNCDSCKTVTDGVEVGEGGPCEPSNPSGPEADATAPKNLRPNHIEQHNFSPPEIEPDQESAGKMVHTGPTNSELFAGGCETEEVPQKEAATDNVLETNIIDELRCIKIEQEDINVEAVVSSLEVDRTVDNMDTSASTSSGPIDVETTPSSHISSTDAQSDESSVGPQIKSEKIIASKEVIVTESGLSHQETAPTMPSLLSEVTTKLEVRGTDTTSAGQVSTSSLGSKDRNSPLEQNKTTSTAGKKKKRREVLLKADAAGTTKDLYMAYKGPEEKQETPLSSDSIDGSTGQMKQESPDDGEEVVIATEDDGQSKSELDDWEDAVDISTPKLKASENGEQVHSAKKHPDEYGSETSGKKKYSRDFLFTFLVQCADLPEGFQVGADLVEVLMSRPVAISHLVDRESHPNSGRIVDRPTGGSRLDRRVGGVTDGDKWSKAPGPFVAGHDPRLDLGHGGVAVNFRPGQGASHGVLRNPRGQPSGQYVGGILMGPMQSLAPPGGMLRNNPDADRWQRATGTQKGLIPSPQTPLQVMHKAERKYEVGKVSDEEQAKQRQLKAILNKLTPQNFEKLFEQVKAVNIDNLVTLNGVISQIFDKALMEPTFCEMYANFCYHLANELPEITEENEKITFKRLLLNKCQEEFERGEREQAEANRVEEEGESKQTDEEREEKRVKARRRMLGNIRLIGELYKKKMLTERIMHQCITKLLGQYQNPDEEDVEALCKLMSTIGVIIDHPRAKEHMEYYFDRMLQLSNNQTLSSRVRFMLKDAIDLRKNRWQQRRKVEGPKKIEDVHRDAAQERQAQTSRLSRGSGFGSSARRGQPIDYGQRGHPMLSSPSTHQMGGIRGLPPQVRGFGNQDVRYEDRHPIESRTLSVPLPQRSDDDSITLGPQGGLARGMSIRGQPMMSNAPLFDVSSNAGDPRRMALGPNGSSDRTPHNSREELAPRYIPDKLMAAPAYDQPNSQERNVSFGNRDFRNADRPFGKSAATSTGHGQLSSTTQNDLSESKVPEDCLRDMSIAAIREFYSARNEEEVCLCIKDLKTPSFYADMVMLWVTDSFDRKNDLDRDLLAKLLVNLCKTRERLLTQVQLMKGFESVLSTLEDAVTDSPKAAEYLGRILGKVIYEDVLPLRDIGRLIHDGGDEPGSLLQSGLASDVLVSIFDIIRKERGDSVLNEIRTSSNLRLEDFQPTDPMKLSKLDAFM